MTRYTVARIYVLSSLLVLLLGSAGCAVISEAVSIKEPEAEMIVQTAAYGTVTQVTSARMHDREIRRGDIAVTVDLDDGRVVIVVQPEDAVYRVGDRVRVVRDKKGFVRVQLLL